MSGSNAVMFLLLLVAVFLALPGPGGPGGPGGGRRSRVTP